MSELGRQARRLYHRHARGEVSDRLLRLGVLVGHPAAETISARNAPEGFATWSQELVAGERETAARAALVAARAALPVWQRTASDHPGLPQALHHLQSWAQRPNPLDAEATRAAAEGACASVFDAAIELGPPTEYDTLAFGCTTLRVGNPFTCELRWKGRAEVAYRCARQACAVPSAGEWAETASEALRLGARLAGERELRTAIREALLPWVGAFLLPGA